MKKLKLATIIGTRPDIIKLSETIKESDKNFDHILIHTGQNYDYELNEIFFKDLGLRKPDHYLDVAGNDLGETIGNVISKSYKLFLKEKPDACLVLGDTNSALSILSAKRLKIPTFHMEAGNRCFDENVPEEINRRLLDHISDINLPYTEHARRNLIAEGLKAQYTFVTGSPTREVLDKNMSKINSSDILTKLKLQKNKYILVSAHREENIDNDSNLESLMEALNEVAEKYKIPIIYSTHPRSSKRIDEKKIKLHSLISRMKPLGFFDYNNLQVNSFCVLSDSGTLSEESSMLNFPGILLRTSTERPESIDKGTMIIGGIKKEGIIQAVEMISKSENKEKSNLIPDYLDNNVSTKVTRIIQGYTEIVNQGIWRKG